MLHGRENPTLVRMHDLAKLGYSEAWLLCKDVESHWPPSVEYAIGKGRIKVSKTVCSYGFTRPKETYSVDIILKNIGSTDLIVAQNPITSCGCTVASIQGSSRIKRGESTTLAASLKPSYAPSIVQEIVLGIRDQETHDERPIRILLCGTQPAVMEIMPTSIDFGRLKNGGLSTRSIYLRQTEADRFQVDKSSIDFSGTPISVSIREREYKRNLTEFQLLCQFHPHRLPAGQHSGNITLTTTSDFNSTVKIPFRCEIEPSFISEPKTLAYGTVERNMRVLQQLKVYCPGCTGEISLSVLAVPSGISISRPVFQDGYCLLSLCFEPTIAGPWDGTVTLGAKDIRNGRRSVLDIACSAFVVSKPD